MIAVPKAAKEGALKNALLHLPSKSLVEYRRGQVIFDQDWPSAGIHRVVEGRVKVSLVGANETVMDIFCADEFFGESGLLGISVPGERAVALEKTTLRSWSRSEVEGQIELQPTLGLALIQIIVDRSLGFQDRVQALAIEKTPGLIARSLLQLAERRGVPEADGFCGIPPLTHQVISDYAGTSRELVTSHMNQLRRMGCIQYSRKSIRVHPKALREYLSAQLPDAVERPPTGVRARTGMP